MVATVELIGTAGEPALDAGAPGTASVQGTLLAASIDPGAMTRIDIEHELTQRRRDLPDVGRRSSRRGGSMEPHQVDGELRRAQAEFHQLITSASPEDLRRPTDGTRWTNRHLLFHMVLGYGVVRTLLPTVRALGRLGYSRGFAATLNAGRRPFHWINYVGPCVAARLLTPRASTALLDRTIGSLRRRLAAETPRDLALSMHMPTGWDPYFTPTMSVRDVYHFGTQHFDHHRRQLTLPEEQAQP